MDQDDNGLKITEKEDGTFTIEWDQNDTRWSWLNNMTEQEASMMFSDTIQKYIEELENENT
jgi:hypothetical protein